MRAFAHLGILVSMSASLLSGAVATAEELSVGRPISTKATVSSSAGVRGDNILRLTLERLPEDPIAPLSLEVLVAGKTEGPGSDKEDIHLTTLSFYGVSPGRTTTFEVPLPDQAMHRVQDGKLPLELRLESSLPRESTTQARVRVQHAVVGPSKSD